ncbi:unnamed protein product [Bemisia tabaci]|uniref:Protein transport protein Sec24A n=2 Tax=Bemisia tabaci TaxID=7038 RepID=A0A9P0CES5_BEMTA|nr:unnamed protein product [Bemisia tabaci]
MDLSTVNLWSELTRSDSGPFSRMSDISEQFPRINAFANGMQSPQSELFPKMNNIHKNGQPPTEQFTKMNDSPAGMNSQPMPPMMQNKMTQPSQQQPQQRSVQQFPSSPNSQPTAEEKLPSALLNGPQNSVPSLPPEMLNSAPSDRLSNLPEQFQKMNVYSNGTEFPPSSIGGSKEVPSPQTSQSQVPPTTGGQFTNQQNSFSQVSTHSPPSSQNQFSNVQKPLTQQSPSLPSSQNQFSFQQKPLAPQTSVPPSSLSQFSNQSNPLAQQSQPATLPPSSQSLSFSNQQKPVVQQPLSQHTMPHTPLSSSLGQFANQQTPPTPQSTSIPPTSLPPSGQSMLTNQQKPLVQQSPSMPQTSVPLSSQSMFSNQQKPLVQQSPSMPQTSLSSSGQSMFPNQQKPLVQQSPLMPQTSLPPSSQSMFPNQQKPLVQQSPSMSQPSPLSSSQSPFTNHQKPLVQQSPSMPQTSLPPSSQSMFNNQQKPLSQQSPSMPQTSLPLSSQSMFSNQQKPLVQQSPSMPQTSSLSQFGGMQNHPQQKPPSMQQMPSPSSSQSQFISQQVSQSSLPPSSQNQLSNQVKPPLQQPLPMPNQFPQMKSPLAQQPPLPPSSQNQFNYQQKQPFQQGTQMQQPPLPPSSQSQFSSQQKPPQMAFNNSPLSGPTPAPPVPTPSPSQRPPSISQQYPKVNAYYNGPQATPPPVSMPSKVVAPTQPPSQPNYSPNQYGNQQKSPYVPYNNTMSPQMPPQQSQNFAQPQYSNQNYSSNMMNRYPAQPGAPGPNVVQGGMNKGWGMEICDLLKTRDILPPEHEDPPPIKLQQELLSSLNCSPSIFRCTLTKIPETKALLDKSRLPLGVLIHPFKDLTKLTVIQSSVIVRCRACRTYINPFIHFVDNKHWKCNLCFRVNELPDDFQYDPTTRTYGDPSRRPEIKSSTLEFIAPSEYMVRPPQPAVYLFLLDVSRLATQSGYLSIVCETLLAHLDNLPGDARTSIGIIAYDSAVHFYSLAVGSNRPHEMTVQDVEDIFLPCPDNLLVNLNESKELVCELLSQLPKKYKESFATDSALGAALQAGYKLLAPSGGRITVFQTCLPNLGPGKLAPREDPALRASENVQHLNPFTDFYKKLALDCSAQQIAVDLFVINSQYVDIASLAGISKFSGGSIYHIPLFSAVNQTHVENLEKMFTRYLIRKIGFESVMRLRCTRGVSIHTFHGNFFVRSTDLLSLPNVNPDAGYGMQVSIDENLTDISNVCFQAALLYTSSQGERRIRVHTLCLPVASSLQEILYSADQECIVGLLSKMAVDRSAQSSLSDAREAFVNAVVDILSAFRTVQSYGGGPGSLLAPNTLRLLPLYVLALLKQTAFRVGSSTRLDDRVFAMNQMKCLPLTFLIQSVYPDLYPVHYLDQVPEVEFEDKLVPQPPRLQLSSERIDKNGIYLMDSGDSFILYVGHNVNPQLLNNLLGVPHFSALPDISCGIAELETPESERLRNFIILLCVEKPYCPPITVLRDNSSHRSMFLERLVEDKYDSGISYYEFLQRIKAQVK